MAEIPAIVATVNGTSSNSYVTVDECLAYMRLRPGGALWLDLDAADRRGTLLFAAILIEREVFAGVKEVATQSMQFPRQPSGADNTIPLAIQHAQCEQALDVANNGYRDREEFTDTQELGVREMRADETTVRMVPSHNGAMPAWKLCSTARNLISPFMENRILVGRA